MKKLIILIFLCSSFCFSQSIDTTISNSSNWAYATLSQSSVDSPTGWTIYNSSTSVSLWVAFSAADTAAASGGRALYSVIPPGFSLDKIATSFRIYFRAASSGSIHFYANKY